LRAQQRVDYVRNLLEQIGLEGERVQMVNLSAAMGARFAEITTEMVEKIKKLGPNPVDGRR
jgi:F420-non-reducing hydrogenase iron-sulfur subunit